MSAPKYLQAQCQWLDLVVVSFVPTNKANAHILRSLPGSGLATNLSFPAFLESVLLVRNKKKGKEMHSVQLYSAPL